MLKKIAYLTITGGFLLAPPGASAMVDDSPFPACNYAPDCANVSHDDAQRDTMTSASESKKKISSRKTQVVEKTGAGDSPFPTDNSKD